jgi:hypothetical protein
MINHEWWSVLLLQGLLQGLGAAPIVLTMMIFMRKYSRSDIKELRDRVQFLEDEASERDLIEGARDGR